LNNSNTRAALNLEPWEEQLYQVDTGFTAPWTSARLDSFYNLHTGELRFIEYNAKRPPGWVTKTNWLRHFLN
jgi:hypothetical protein